MTRESQLLSLAAIAVLVPTRVVAQTPIWQDPAARLAVGPQDRGIVYQLDRDWNTKSAKRVLKGFSHVHPQARSALGKRVQLEPGRRQTKILGVSREKRCRCLYLETVLTSEGGRKRTIFEVLVLLGRDRALRRIEDGIERTRDL